MLILASKYCILRTMKKEKFIVRGLAGAKTLRGAIRVNGAKNAALQAFAFSFLFEGSLELANVPAIEDTERMVDLVHHAGAQVVRVKPDQYRITLPKQIKAELPHELARHLRASVVLTGPLLARTGKVTFPHPGGCVIGNRPIDIFLDGFQKMGAKLTQVGENYVLTAPKKKLRGAEIFLRTVSVTATQTFMMAATLAQGTTVIKNAAMEPETESLAVFLNRCGAHIEGAGTSTITIHGGKPLHAGAGPYNVPPDRIETGSFLILAALAGKEIEITDCEPLHVEALLDALQRAGVDCTVRGSTIRVRQTAQTKAPYTSVDLKTHEYPGFPTDLQAPMVVFLTQAKGEALVFETIFEGRLNYTESLIRMGADIKMWDTHRVTVKGPTRLRSKELESPDIRAGLAYLIAAIVAKGESVIHNAYYIDRGYEKIEERLRAIGVDIRRVAE